MDLGANLIQIRAFYGNTDPDPTRTSGYGSATLITRSFVFSTANILFLEQIVAHKNVGKYQNGFF